MGKGHTVGDCGSPKDDIRIAENRKKVLGGAMGGKSQPQDRGSNQLPDASKQQGDKVGAYKRQINQLQAKLAQLQDPFNENCLTI
jgi:TolA-binding protein